MIGLRWRKTSFCTNFMCSFMGSFNCRKTDGTIFAAISRAGLERRVTSVRTLNMPVLELQDHEKLMTNLYQECKKAIEEDHVSVLVMGCTGIVGINAEMVNRLRKDGYDIPVLEAAQCAMTLLELYAKMGLYQSRETYMEPPKKG